MLFTALQGLRRPLDWRAAVLWLALAITPVAWSQTVEEASAWLGMSPQQLQPALPGAQAVRAPRRLPTGALGLLRVADVQYEGIHFEQTLYFRADRLEQLDMVWHADADGAAQGDDAAAYTALVAAVRGRLGPELASASSTATTVMETASWVHGGANILLYRSGKSDHPVVRLVIRQRQVVDGSEL